MLLINNTFARYHLTTLLDVIFLEVLYHKRLLPMINFRFFTSTSVLRRRSVCRTYLTLILALLSNGTTPVTFSANFSTIAGRFRYNIPSSVIAYFSCICCISKLLTFQIERNLCRLLLKRRNMNTTPC